METSPRFPETSPNAAATPASGILAGLTAGLASGDDLQDLMSRFLRPLIDLAGAQAGAVRVCDDDGRRMRLIASLGLPAEVQDAERSVEAACGACGAALHGQQPAWSHQLESCVRRSEGAYFGSRCLRIAAVPLVHRARTLGILNLFYEGDAAATAEVLALLDSVAALLGLALDNNRLERESLRAARADERQAIAAEVHDSIGQSLAFVKMRLPLLHDAIRGGDPEQAERYCDDVRAAVGQAHASLRAVLTHMRSPMDPRGLAHAVAESAAAFRQRSDAVLEVVNRVNGLRLAEGREEQVFHIVHEALANIARHAAAGHAWLRLERAGESLQVVVEDDGRGLPAGADSADTHYGLAIMRERARRLGGTLEIGPRRPAGTRVGLRFALSAAELASANAGAPIARVETAAPVAPGVS